MTMCIKCVLTQCLSNKSSATRDAGETGQAFTLCCKVYKVLPSKIFTEKWLRFTHNADKFRKRSGNLEGVNSMLLAFFLIIYQLFVCALVATIMTKEYLCSILIVTLILNTPP